MNDIVTTWLYRYPDIENQISQLRKDIVAILEDKYAVRASGSGGAIHKNNNNNQDVVCRVIVCCDEQINQKQRRILELSKIKDCIDRVIDGMKFHEAELVRLKYFEGKTWEEISKEMCLNTKRLYNMATAIKVKISEELGEKGT
jgi:predicted DNA-binding protein (UPF0251 family)